MAHFKSLALRNHAPESRANLAKTWLECNAASCTDVQLAMLLANSHLNASPEASSALNIANPQTPQNTSR